MKNFKLGFTLSELLLCVGIIAIVSAMGMTISKKGTESAYKLYFYTGYVNLYNALGENGGLNNLKNLCDMFTNSQWDAATNTCTASNNIRYILNNPITMSVPAPVTRANPNGRQSVDLLYDNNNGLLIPREQNPAPAGYTNLQNRLDLLRVYIDNGTVGRVAMNGSAPDGSSPAPINYMTYREAYCHLYNYEKIDGVIDCNDINQIGGLANSGVLRFAPPRR